MTIETTTVTLPAYYASYYVNGDSSGMTDEEEANAKRLEAKLNSEGWRIVGTTDEEARFTWSFKLYGGESLGGDVLDYIIHRDVA